MNSFTWKTILGTILVGAAIIFIADRAIKAADKYAARRAAAVPAPATT